MIVTILGCGTSTGVPVPACACAICASSDPRNKRLRCSAHIATEAGASILLDASPDLRQQTLRAGITEINGVLFTHSHADHILGVEDLRGFNFSQKGKIPCYGIKETLADIRRMFFYVFEVDPNYLGGQPPQLDLLPVTPYEPITICGKSVLPLTLLHGHTPTCGYRIGNFSYVTDCKEIPSESLRALEGTEVLVLDGLRYEAHRTHLTIPEAISLSEQIGAHRTVLTHLTHTVDYTEVSRKLPPRVELGYDGLKIEINEHI